MRTDLFYTINTEQNYNLGLNSGMFWVHWPDLTGVWEKDKLIILKNMTAKEARIIAETYINDTDTSQLNEIKKLIKSRSEKGEFDIIYYSKISVQVTDWLQKEGFIVSEPVDGRGGEIDQKISW